MTRMFLTHYLGWHYRDAITDYFRVWLNVLWFIVHFFSIGYLIRHLFQPFKRIVEKKSGKTMDVGGFFGRLILNTVMRLVGAVTRGIIILSGLGIAIASSLIGFAGFFVWLGLPLIAIGLIVAGFVIPGITL